MLSILQLMLHMLVPVLQLQLTLLTPLMLPSMGALRMLHLDQPLEELEMVIAATGELRSQMSAALCEQKGAGECRSALWS